MEILIGFVGGMFRYLLINTVFFGVGVLVIKCLTLGRYPRSLDPRKPDSADFEMFSLIGLLTLTGIVILLAWLNG